MFVGVHFLSYKQICTLKDCDDIVIISIFDPQYAAPYLPFASHRILSLKFSDIDFHRGDTPSKGSVIFGQSHAKVIREWVQTHNALSAKFDLVIHCWAGLSRSAAVAWWAAHEYQIPLITTFPSYHLNLSVLNCLNKAVPSPTLPQDSLSFGELQLLGRSIECDNSLAWLLNLPMKN